MNKTLQRRKSKVMSWTANKLVTGILVAVTTGVLLLITLSVWIASAITNSSESESVRTTYNNCKVTNLRSYFIKIRVYAVESSCGGFKSSKSTNESLEIGKSYDFGVKWMNDPVIVSWK